MRWHHLTLVAASIQLALAAGVYAADVQAKIDQLNAREKQLIEKIDALQQRQRYLQDKLDEVRHRKEVLLNRKTVQRPGQPEATPTP
jgi:phage shock protein A